MNIYIDIKKEKEKKKKQKETTKEVYKKHTI